MSKHSSASAELGDGAERPGANRSSGKAEAKARAAKAEINARLWRELIDLDARLHEQRNIRLLTPEARVLIHLKINGPTSVTTAMKVAGTSYRGFYAVLQRLKQAGIIAALKDDQDHRVRKLSIDPSMPTLPSL